MILICLLLSLKKYHWFKQMMQHFIRGMMPGVVDLIKEELKSFVMRVDDLDLFVTELKKISLIWANDAVTHWRDDARLGQLN